MCYLYQKDRKKLHIKPRHLHKSTLHKSLREKHKSKSYKKRFLKRREKNPNMERRTGLEPATISLEG